MGRGISRFLNESLLIVKKSFPIKSEARESTGTFAGTSLMIMVVNIGGGLGPVLSSSSLVVVAGGFC